MEGVMPRGRTVPSHSRRVRVLVGHPIPVDDLFAAADAQRWGDDRLHAEVASRVAEHLGTLKAALADASAAAGADAPLPDDARRALLALAPASCGGIACGGGVGGAPGVSGLDLYDEADVRWHHRASVWEKA
eukprot:270818-Chlamydomonas_euryale.AAC.1